MLTIVFHSISFPQSSTCWIYNTDRIRTVVRHLRRQDVIVVVFVVTCTETSSLYRGDPHERALKVLAHLSISHIVYSMSAYYASSYVSPCYIDWLHEDVTGHHFRFLNRSSLSQFIFWSLIATRLMSTSYFNFACFFTYISLKSCMLLVNFLRKPFNFRLFAIFLSITNTFRSETVRCYRSLS